MRIALLLSAAVVLGAISQLGDDRTPASPASPAATATPAPTATIIATSGAPARGPDIHGEPATVATVTDGDTFQLTDGRKVRLIGIDSCEDTGSKKTPGGALATAEAERLLGGAEVRLVTEPGAPDADRNGRLLRYVLLPDGRDFGVAMVGWDHTGIYTDSKGRQGGDASQAYLDQLRAHDLDHAASPPSGRECGAYPPPPPPVDDGPEYVPVPDGGDDGDDGESRFCRRRWWC